MVPTFTRLLTGRADCPYYAKAEVLADYLQKNLPNFRIHKITQHPDTWEEWLADLCVKNGWKHNRSPIIWRELLDCGSKGLLLGGFNDFMEHAQEYYNVTSAMMSDLMMGISAENMQTYLDVEEEEDNIRKQFNPLHIWIIGASMPACYSLIPILASGNVLGVKQDLWLHLLDHSHSQHTLQGLKMEAEDLAYPCLRKVTLHTITDDAFLQADFVIVLNDVLANEDQRSEAQISKIKKQCTRYGALIDQNARKDVKVIVFGTNYVNLIALLIIKHAPSINPHNIVALPTQLEFEAKAQIAKKLNINSSVIKDVVVWGNISGINLLDFHLAKMYKYDNSIWGPSNFSRPLIHMIHDRFQSSLAVTVISRSSPVLPLKQRNKPGAPTHSKPMNGDWQVCTHVTIQDDAKETLLHAAAELIKEKNIALGILQEEQIASEEPKREELIE
ncbi:putative malate dehydrogenase 1B isoform X2 [Dendrobates tinctorius]|uniref:putative malate dehydrogenase 1B isoform X2 n=1 Tax=Dendrobates tinctorius TaxID=92724 RepID=UPI003CC9E4C6